MSTENPSFLPFITKNSPEEVVFKAILQRTKGSTETAVFNLFTTVIIAGIDKVRADMNNLGSEFLTTSEKVAQVVSQVSAYHVSKNERKFWAFAKKYVKTKTKSITEEQQQLFFTVLAVHKPESLKSNGYEIKESLYKKLLEVSKEEYDLNISDIENVIISNNDLFRVGFTCWEEFKAYIATKSDKEITTEVYPVYIKSSKSTQPTSITYSENHCAPPYKESNDEA
jgi:hypothetical protein